MSVSELESYDLIRFAELLEQRLSAAQQQLAAQEGLAPEKSWLDTALSLLLEAQQPATALLPRVRDLAELAEVREEFAEELQNAWVDAMEKLHAGITFSASSRTPVIDALFPHLKFAILRRGTAESVNDYQQQFIRRLNTSYVTRLMAQEEFELVRPVIAKVTSAHEAWQQCLAPLPLPEAEAVPLREELKALGTLLDQRSRQARLLSEAALMPLPGLFEESGLSLKPRRRSLKGVPLNQAETTEALPESSEALIAEEESPPPESQEETSPEPVEATPAPASEEAPVSPAPETPAPAKRRSRKKNAASETGA